MKKRCSIVVLPTKNPSKIFLDSNGIFNVGSEHLTYNSDVVKAQHLYIYSDCKLKNNDYSLVLNKIDKVKDVKNDATSIRFDIHGLMFDKNTYPKIIASTDTTLGLPLIPINFIDVYIEKYNNDNKITELDLEFDCDHIQMPNKIIDVVKIDSKGYINILEIQNENTKNMKQDFSKKRNELDLRTFPQCFYEIDRRLKSNMIVNDKSVMMGEIKDIINTILLGYPTKPILAYQNVDGSITCKSKVLTAIEYFFKNRDDYETKDIAYFELVQTTFIVHNKVKVLENFEETRVLKY